MTAGFLRSCLFQIIVDKIIHTIKSFLILVLILKLINIYEKMGLSIIIKEYDKITSLFGEVFLINYPTNRKLWL